MNDRVIIWETARAMPALQLTGRELRGLMRKHRVTIRGLASKMQITQKRIRQVRKAGISGLAVLDWQEGITGEFTPRMRAQLRQYVATNLN